MIGNKHRVCYGTLVLMFFTIIKLALTVAKLGLGWYYASVAVTGDGVHDLTDVAGAVMVGVSMYLAAQPANTSHPFGRARIEYVMTSVIGVTILYAGSSLLMESIQRIYEPVVMIIEEALILSLFLALILQGGIVYLFHRLKTELESQLVRALNVDAYSDLLLTGTVIASLMVEWIAGCQIDAYAGLLVSFVLIGGGIRIIYNGIDYLLGKGIPPHEKQEITEFIQGFNGVYGVHDVMVHDYGPGYRFLSCHIEVDSQSDLLTAHQLADDIEIALRRRFLLQALIHIDPKNVTDPRAIKIEKDMKDLVYQLHPKWDAHGFYIMKEDDAWRVTFDVSITDNGKQSDEEIDRLIRMKVKERYPRYRLGIHIDRHHVLSHMRQDVEE